MTKLKKRKRRYAPSKPGSVRYAGTTEKSDMMTFRIPKDLHGRLKSVAERQQRAKSEVVVNLLTAALPAKIVPVEDPNVFE